jgi:hypothetical protein
MTTTVTISNTATDIAAKVCIQRDVKYSITPVEGSEYLSNLTMEAEPWNIFYLGQEIGIERTELIFRPVTKEYYGE